MSIRSPFVLLGTQVLPSTIGTQDRVMNLVVRVSFINNTKGYLSDSYLYSFEGTYLYITYLRNA